MQTTHIPIEIPKLTSAERLLLFLVILLCLMAPFGMDAYVPSLPAMTRYFQTTPHMMQWTVSTFLFGGVFSQLLCGPWSDKVGRRPIVFMAVIIAFIGSILCFFANSPALLIAARFVQGFGVGMSNGLFRAIMRDTFSGLRMAKVASQVSTVFIACVGLAPVIGGYLQDWFDWRGTFGFFVILCVAIFTILFRFLPETNLKLNPQAMQARVVLHNYFTLISSRVFVGYTLCSSLTLGGVMLYFTVSPFLLENIVGLSPVIYGWLALCIAVGLIIGIFLNTHLIARFGLRYMIGTGLSIMAISAFAMLFIGIAGVLNTPVIVIPAICFSLASGFVYANAMAGAFEPFAHMAGIAGALYGAFQLFVSFLTTSLATMLHVHNQNPLAALMAVIALLGLLTWKSLPKKDSTEV